MPFPPNPRSVMLERPRNLSASRVRWHEASHAVVARALDYPVQSVSARQSGKYRGLTDLDLRACAPSEEFWERQIMVVLAGPLGEIRQFPYLDFETDVLGNSLDVWNAYNLAHELALMRGLPQPVLPPERMLLFPSVYPATEKLVNDLQGPTQGLLDANWPAIERVAKALHRNARLNQSALDAVIGRGC